MNGSWTRVVKSSNPDETYWKCPSHPAARQDKTNSWLVPWKDKYLDRKKKEWVKSLLLKWYVMENHCITFTSGSQLLIDFAKLQQLLLSEVFWIGRVYFLLVRGQKAMPKSSTTWKIVFMWKVTRFGSFCAQPGPVFERENLRTGFPTHTSTAIQVIFPIRKDTVKWY